MEHIQLRAPRPTTVRRGGVLPPAQQDRFIVVRAAATLRRQFALRHDPWPPNGGEPVVAVRTRQGEQIELYPIADPAAVAAVRVDGRPLLVSIALRCARDERWAGAWSTAFAEADVVTILMDKPFGQCVDALLAGDGQLTYTIMPGPSTDAPTPKDRRRWPKGLPSCGVARPNARPAPPAAGRLGRVASFRPPQDRGLTQALGRRCTRS